MHDDEHFGKQIPECAKHDFHEMPLDRNMRMHKFEGGSERSEHLSNEKMGVQGLGELTPEAHEYILHLQSRLDSANIVCLDESSTNEVSLGQITNFSCEPHGDFVFKVLHFHVCLTANLLILGPYLT